MKIFNLLHLILVVAYYIQNRFLYDYYVQNLAVIILILMAYLP